MLVVVRSHVCGSAMAGGMLSGRRLCHLCALLCVAPIHAWRTVARNAIPRPQWRSRCSVPLQAMLKAGSGAIQRHAAQKSCSTKSVDALCGSVAATVATARSEGVEKFVFHTGSTAAVSGRSRPATKSMVNDTESMINDTLRSGGARDGTQGTECSWGRQEAHGCPGC